MNKIEKMRSTIKAMMDENFEKNYVPFEEIEMFVNDLTKEEVIKQWLKVGQLTLVFDYKRPAEKNRLDGQVYAPIKYRPGLIEIIRNVFKLVLEYDKDRMKFTIKFPTKIACNMMRRIIYGEETLKDVSEWVREELFKDLKRQSVYLERDNAYELLSDAIVQCCDTLIKNGELNFYDEFNHESDELLRVEKTESAGKRIVLNERFISYNSVVYCIDNYFQFDRNGKYIILKKYQLQRIFKECID